MKEELINKINGCHQYSVFTEKGQGVSRSIHTPKGERFSKNFLGFIDIDDGFGISK